MESPIISLGDLLLKYSIPGIRSAEQRRICAEEAGKVLNLPVASKDIEYKNERIIFRLPPVVKSALLLKQSELIENLQGRGITVRSFK